MRTLAFVLLLIATVIFAQSTVMNHSGGASTTTIPTVLTGTASLNFADPSASTCTAAQTITVTGAIAGEPVILGVPSTITIGANQFFPEARVTATNTVSIVFCELTATTNDPAAGTFTVKVIH